MIIDFQRELNVTALEKGDVIIVNGVPLRGVCYVDTKKGIVKTFDIKQDGEYYMGGGWFDRSLFPQEWEIENSGSEEVVKRVFRGKVEIIRNGQPVILEQ